MSAFPDLWYRSLTIVCLKVVDSFNSTTEWPDYATPRRKALRACTVALAFLLNWLWPQCACATDFVGRELIFIRDLKMPASFFFRIFARLFPLYRGISRRFRTFCLDLRQSIPLNGSSEYEKSLYFAPPGSTMLRSFPWRILRASRPAYRPSHPLSQCIQSWLTLICGATICQCMGFVLGSINFKASAKLDLRLRF